MGNKVNKSKKKRGWRKNNAKRMHEAMKARHLKAENFENKENTPVASVNVPVVGISQQNIFGLFDDAMKERQLQTENIEEQENTVASVNVQIDTSLLNQNSSDEPARINALDDTNVKIYHTLELVPITLEQNYFLPGDEELDNDMTCSHSKNNAIKLPFDEIQKLQQLAAIYKLQDNPNLSAQHLQVNSDQEEDYYIMKPEEKVDEIRISGNRVVDFMYLFEQLQDISHHNSPLGCNFND